MIQRHGASSMNAPVNGEEERETQSEGRETEGEEEREIQRERREAIERVGESYKEREGNRERKRA